LREEIFVQDSLEILFRGIGAQCVGEQAHKGHLPRHDWQECTSPLLIA
jgi:succinyl-CoA synthetase alpha subunit